MQLTARHIGLALLLGALTTDEVLSQAGTGSAGFVDQCFQIHWGVWHAGSEVAELDMRALPTTVWLTDQQLVSSHDATQLRVLRVAPDEREPGFAASHWRYETRNRELVLEWSTPFQGVRASFAADSSAGGMRQMRGVAATWSHRAGDRMLEATVELTPRPCL